MVRRYVNGLRDLSLIEPPWESPEEVWTDPSGAYSIVKCNSQWDYQLETYFLAHCLGTKDYAEFSKAHVAYSLRDRRGIPHATILCLRAEEYSPYGLSWDIGGYNSFTPEDSEPELRILQVRGRQDDIAMPPFHAIVRAWYTLGGGKVAVNEEKFEAFLRRFGDSDFDYHFRYLLDEERNYFNWAYWNAGMRSWGRRTGRSL